MGGVCSSRSSGLKLLKTHRYKTLLELPVFTNIDRSAYENANIEFSYNTSLIFYVQLSKIILKSTEFKKHKYLLLVSWDKIIARSKLLIPKDGIITIDYDWSFKWHCGETLKTLKKTYLVIALYEIKFLLYGNLVGYMYVPTYNLAVGPIQNNYSLISSNRISIQFQCILTQLCNVYLTFAELLVNITDMEKHLKDETESGLEVNLIRNADLVQGMSNWRIEFKNSGTEFVNTTSWTETTLHPHWINLPNYSHLSNKKTLILKQISKSLATSHSIKDDSIYNDDAMHINNFDCDSEPITTSHSDIMNIDIDENNPYYDEKLNSYYHHIANDCKKNGHLFGDTVSTPYLSFIATSEDFREYGLHITLKYKSMASSDVRFYGDALIPYYKLIDCQLANIDDHKFVDAEFSTLLWDNGVSKGVVKGVLVFQGIPLLQQLLAGVNTEIGTRLAVSPLPKLLGSSIDQPEIIIELSRSIDELRKQWKNFNETSNIDKKLTHTSMTMNKISSICENLYNLLEPKSYFDFFYDYNYIDHLVNCQTLLVEITQILLDTYSFVPWTTKNSYLKTITAILKCKELGISNIVPHRPSYVVVDASQWRSIFDEAKESIDKIKFNEANQNRANKWSKLRAYISSTHRSASFSGMINKKKIASNSFISFTNKDLKASAKSRSKNQKNLVLHKSKKYKHVQSNTFINTLSMRRVNRLLYNFSRADTKDASSVSYGDSKSKVNKNEPNDNNDIDFKMDSLHEFFTTIANSDEAIHNGEFADTPPTDQLFNGSSNTFGYSINNLSNKTIKTIEDALNNFTATKEILLFERRLEIGKLYLELLISLLKLCLQELKGPALFETQKQFFAVILALLFNRLPTLRREILMKVLTVKERLNYLPGWKGNEFLLNGKSLDQKDNWSMVHTQGLAEIKMVLNWNPLIDLLKSYYNDLCNEELILTELLNDYSFDWLNPRGTFFFQFACCWIKSINSLFESSKSNKLLIRWDLIPGYATMLKAFLIELKTKSVDKFPDAMLNCSLAFLVNDRLLSVFMKFILYRVNVYKRREIVAAYNYLDFWLEFFRAYNQKGCISIDSGLLGKAIEITLSSDLNIQMSKVLWFLYRQIDQFVNNIGLVNVILELLLHNYFYKLLLHWSYVIRSFFIQLLLFRICEIVRKIVVKWFNPKKSQKMSVAEKLWCWSYILITRNLNLIGIPAIFNNKFESIAIYKLLSQPISKNELIGANIPWGIPLVLPLKSKKKQNTNGKSIELKSQQIICSDWLCNDFNNIRPILAKEQFNAKTNDINYNTAFNHSNIKRELSDSKEYLLPNNYLPQPVPFTESEQKYIIYSIKELQQIQDQYKNWIIATIEEVPPLVLPNFYSDTNVELPLDENLI